MRGQLGRDSVQGHHFLAVVSLSLALLTAGCGGAGGAGGSYRIVATTSVLPGRGTVVFTDDFHDRNSGWTTLTLPSGTRFTYGNRQYVVVATGALHHYAYSPFEWPEQQLSAGVTATLSSGGALLSGFGIGCRRGSGGSEIRYELLVTGDGRWFVERGSGAPSTTTASTNLLKQGTAPVTPGATPLTLEGLCATLQDGHTTRLMLFVGGQQVADMVDTADALPDRGWVAELVVLSSASANSTVIVTNFIERDAAH